MMAATAVDVLADYIRTHSTDAHVTPGGELWAVVQFTQRVDGGLIAWSQSDRIEPTFSAVRDWLGY